MSMHAISRRGFFAVSAGVGGMLASPISAKGLVAPSPKGINWKQWAARKLYWIIRLIDYSLFYVAASKTVGTNNVRVTSGSIEYNNGTNGPSSYIDVEATSPYSGTPYINISLSVTTTFLTSFTSVMAVTLTNPSGSYVINTTLGNNGIKVFTVNSAAAEGTYRATFSVTAREKWSGSVWVYDHNGPASRTLEEADCIVNESRGKCYLIPSKNVNRSEDQHPKDELNVDELYEQFWDEKLEEYVYLLTDYDIGTSLIISDTIHSITYDEILDRTIIGFLTRRGEALWPFDGNLTDRYSVGNFVSFSMRVIPEYEDGRYTFESLDYFDAAERKLIDREAPLEIDDYLA